MTSSQNMVFLNSDYEMQNLASDHLGYTHHKGLDFIGRFNNKYILGEAKFLTDFGGHQNAQFDDAIATLTAPIMPTKYNVSAIAILDGVIYLKSQNKLHKQLLEYAPNYTILSAILLRNYLYSL